MGIKELKKENKVLRSKLNKDDKNFIDAVSFYLDQFQLSSLERQEIMNQIYRDVMKKIEVNNSLWFIIEDPVKYCDQFLWGKEKKVKNIKKDRIRIIVTSITMTLIYVIGLNISPSPYLLVQDKNTIVVTMGMLIYSISIILIIIVPNRLRQARPFNEDYYNMKFNRTLGWILFLLLIVGGFSRHLVIFTVDAYPVYIITFVCAVYLILIRKRI